MRHKILGLALLAMFLGCDANQKSNGLPEYDVVRVGNLKGKYANQFNTGVYMIEIEGTKYYATLAGNGLCIGPEVKGDK